MLNDNTHICKSWRKGILPHVTVYGALHRVFQKERNSTIIKNLKRLIKFEYMPCIPPERTIFLVSNDMRFGYINRTIYYLIDILVRMENFKYSIL